MVFGLFDLEGAEIDGFLLGGVGESSVEEGGYSGNDQNDACDLHLSSRSLMKMRSTQNGCSGAGRGAHAGDGPSLSEGGSPQRMQTLSVEARSWVLSLANVKVVLAA